MATLEQIIQFQIALTGEAVRRFGDKATPTDLTVTGQVWDSGNFPLADNYGNAEIWATTQGGLASFAYLIFMADVDVILELANTTPNPDERALFNIAANSVLVLPSSVMGGYASNTSRLDGAAMVSATDFNTINSIRVQRNAANLAGDATCRLMLVL